MGKTGTTIWAQVKGVKGQIRLVPKKEAELKTPGPNQRFKQGAKNVKAAEGEEQRGGFRGRSGGRGGGHGGARGGRRGSDRDTVERTGNPLIRRRMRRAKVSAMGTKAKSK
ncbi:MAG: hypothetical protein A4E35_01024 [Methanoregula sp. PtaU1.Bin051]|nr:MAG: hypothetical protein A4E35_01024 [Methanoregula sp. PtaU1.Bin051]